MRRSRPDATAVRSWAVVLPHRRKRVLDLPEFAGAGEDERCTVSGLGINTVIADDRLTSAGFAASAAGECLAAGGLVGEEVDVVILCQSRAPTHFMSSEATCVQERVGAARALSFTLADVGCVAVSAAMRLARDLLRDGRRCTNVLVTMGSKPHGARRYRPGVTVAGDGGAAVLLSRDGSRRIVDIDVQTSGRYWDLYRVDFRGVPVEEWTETCKDPRRYSFDLAVESRNRLRSLTDDLLERHRLAWRDLDHFVMQNLSRGAFAFYEQALGMPVARACRDNLARYGHLGSGDIVANLKAGEDTGEFEPGARVLVFNNSPAAAWSVMLYEP